MKNIKIIKVKQRVPGKTWMKYIVAPLPGVKINGWEVPLGTRWVIVDSETFDVLTAAVDTDPIGHETERLEKLRREWTGK